MWWSGGSCTSALTDDLFVLGPGGGDGLQQQDGLQLHLHCDVSLNQDVQNREDPSILQELQDVLMTGGTGAGGGVSDQTKEQEEEG